MANIKVDPAERRQMRGISLSDEEIDEIKVLVGNESLTRAVRAMVHEIEELRGQIKELRGREITLPPPLPQRKDSGVQLSVPWKWPTE